MPHIYAAPRVHDEAHAHPPVREDFQTSKGLAGLDQHQVRRWDSWHRWATLAMLAAAFLTITAATEHAREIPPSGRSH